MSVQLLQCTLIYMYCTYILYACNFFIKLFLVHLKAICRVPVVLRNNYNNNEYSLSCGTYIFFPNLVILSTWHVQNHWIVRMLLIRDLQIDRDLTWGVSERNKQGAYSFLSPRVRGLRLNCPCQLLRFVRVWIRIVWSRHPSQCPFVFTWSRII